MVDTSFQDLALFIGAFSLALALITVCLRYNYAVQVLYNPILVIAKTSILMFFLRLAGQKIEIRRMIWALLILNNAFMVAIFIVVIFQFTPQLDIDGGSCIEQGTFYAAASVIALITDILVLIVPFWIVIGLKMPRKPKIAVIGIFFLGILVTIWFPKLFGPSSDGAYNNQSGRYALQGNSRYERRTWNGAGFKSSRVSTGNGLIRLEDIPDIPDDKNGRTEDSNRIQRARSKGHGDSDEEIMKYDGIIKTTSVGVQYEDGKSNISDAQYPRRTSVESV
ncbi:hypothetical protein EAF00_009321 [Botryotinia globosa]|nr:hypothetical protein EAF00_009321 [Botryotinia globosa]